VLSISSRLQRLARLGTISSAIVVLALLVLSGIPGSSSGLAGSIFATTASSSDIHPGAGSGAAFSAIQAQINRAAAGATVHLPAGTFVGQLLINQSIKLVGAGEKKTFLRSPTTMAPDYLGNVFVLEIGNHSTVSISKLSVQVTEQCMLSNSIGVATGGGIGVGGNSTLHVRDVAAYAYGPYPNLNAACTTSTGSLGMYSFGRAISIGLDDPPGVGTNQQIEGHGTIFHVLAKGFDIFSLSVGGVRGLSDSTATIAHNVVRVGPGPYTAAYGIVVYGNSTVSYNLVTGEAGSDGGIADVYASAVITHNTVLNFTCLTAPFPITPACGVDPIYDDQDLGIFLASISTGTVVQFNTIRDVDAGILVEGPEPSAIISHNRILNSTFYSLDVIDAVQTFKDNTLSGAMFAIAVAAEAANATGVLFHDRIRGDSVGIALTEAISPWIAQVVIVPK
jgi:hypothetical protein